MAGDIWLSDDDDGPPESAERPASWRRWLPLAAVFVLGAVVALVVADARRDAAGSATIELLSGGSSLNAVIGDAGSADSVEFYLFNTGAQEVEIVTVTVDGFTADPDADEPTTATAEPGEWVSFVTDLVPDCGERPSGDLNVIARGGAGEETLHPELAPGAFDDAIAYWGMSCRSLREVVLSVELERAELGAKLTTVLAVSQSSTRPALDIVELESGTPGVLLEGADDVLPVTIRSDRPPTEITVQWSIDRCGPAMAMTDLGLEALISAPGGGGERVTIDTATPLSVELARLSERVCET